MKPFNIFDLLYPRSVLSLTVIITPLTNLQNKYMRCGTREYTKYICKKCVDDMIPNRPNEMIDGSVTKMMGI